MKPPSILIALTCCLLHQESARSAEAFDQTKVFDDIYERWHAGIESNTFLSEQFFFETEGGSPELKSAVHAIKTNGLEFAVFLCEKIASGQNNLSRLYSDARLLRRISGIELIYDESLTGQKIIANSTNLAARFRVEWTQGAYRDPGKKISQLCKDLLPKEKNTKIEARDLLALRRYGVFGLPEIINQIRQFNSKHAFASYLIITDQPERYSEYIVQTDRQFVTKEEKLADIEKAFEQLKKTNAATVEIVKQISAALATK